MGNINIESDLVKAVVEGIQDNKGKSISILDMRGVDGAITDFFVICEGSSNVQVDAIADSVFDKVIEQQGERPLHQEGRANAEWILLDYHDVIVHVFQSHIRSYYNLEGLWSDAKRTDLPDLD